MTQLDNVRQMILHLRNSIEGRAPEKELLHLHEVIRGAIETHRHRQEQMNVRIETSLAAQNDVVVANTLQMRRVSANLICNTYDAVEDCAECTLSISSSAVGENAIRIDVADTGTGISPAVKTRIFEPLITTKAHGLGVGLSIIHSIVKEHRGRMRFGTKP